MNDAILLILVFLAGLVLGAFFFLGLRWTVKKAVSAKAPALWFFGSLLIRLGIVILGIYIVSQSHWERMLICLSGFLIARVIVMRITRDADPKTGFKINAESDKGGAS